MSARLFLGIDVGTGNARAGLFDAAGDLLAGATRPFSLFRDGVDLAEHDADEVWRAVCSAVRTALDTAGAQPQDVAGIGFDATCSLVVLGPGGAPLPVGRHGIAARNVIVWMDHRATDQARRINATGHRVLDHLGGTVSPEMETPKLLWLKENLPETYASAWQFMDLADYLTWRATGSLARSSCTVTCKWTWLGHAGGWQADYFGQIGLRDLADDSFARIGTQIVEPGVPLAAGLTAQAAADLGLAAGTPVASGLIDAHAGGIGTLGAPGEGGPLTRMAYVMGTSACTMASIDRPLFIPGVWGPYHYAMVPGLWLSEGGQSAAGAAIDCLLSMHPAAAAVGTEAASHGRGLAEYLADLAAAAVQDLSSAAHLARGLIVIPDFLGNRAPHADPGARGLIAGLDLAADRDSLIALYVAGLTGLGYGLRQIVEASRAGGVRIETLVPSGGAGRHPLVRQLLSDCTGLPLEIPRTVEPVLLGSAMLGASAAGAHGGLKEAMAAMSSMAATVRPAVGGIAALHARRFGAFELLQAGERRARAILEDHR